MFLLCSLLFLSTTVWAQQTVSGTVLDEGGSSIIGATVMVKGSTNGTVTDLDGKYVLSNVPPKSVLVFSYIGFETQEVKVDGRTTINVTMSEAQQLLDEVVVVGYGSLSRKELSSSIVQVDKDQFQQGSMNNAMEMLTGKVAGLNVATSSPADPNGSSSLQIRGAAS